MGVKEEVKARLTSTQIGKIRIWRRWLRRMSVGIRSLAHSADLNKLAAIHECDKWGTHWYTPHYQKHFESIRKRPLKVLEIGVGGYDCCDEGGNSLRMWKYFFPKSRIYSIDIYDKHLLEERRITIFKGDQSDSSFLRKVIDQMGFPDIIIDDGSHVNPHVLESFHTLFPLMREGGIYVIEDTQTSYWPDHGGSNMDLNNPHTAMGYFKKLTDGLNYQEYLDPGYKPSYWDLNIRSIHFYHNLIFIYKGLNKEPAPPKRPYDLTGC